ncbi:MAG: PQQ-binding-like beta-propeller repeat protein [Spirochaetota bacterium]
MLQSFCFSQPYSPTGLEASEHLPAEDSPRDSRFVLDWKYPTGGRVLALTAGQLDRSRLYVLSEDRRLYCLRSDGSLLWRGERLPARPHPFLQQSRDGTLYLSLEPSRIAAYTPSGRAIWIRSGTATSAEDTGSTEWLRRGPDGLVYSLSGRTLTLRTHTGAIVWQEKLKTVPAAPPVYDGLSSLWTVSEEGRLLRIDASGIASLARLPSGRNGGAAALQPGAIRCVADPTGIAVAVNKKLWFFNPRGDLKWDADLYSPAEELSIDEQRVYIRTAGNRIAAVARDSGQELWSSPLPMDAGRISAGSGHNFVVYGSRSLQLYRGDDGQLQAALSIPQPSVQPLKFGSDQLIIGGEDWVVYSYRSRFLRPPAAARRAGNSPDQPADRSADRVHPSAPTFEEVILEEAGRKEYLLLLDELAERADTTVSSKNYPELLSLLTQLAGMGVINPVRRRGEYVNDFPDVRLRAVELLAQNGTLDSQEVLLRLLQYEWDPRVKVELLRAIARLQSGLGGRVVETLRGSIKNGGIDIDEDPLMTAELIRCIERVSLYSGTVRPAAGHILMDIYRSNAPRALRMQAVSTLRELGSHR